MAVAVDAHSHLLPHGLFRLRVLTAIVRYQWLTHLRWIFAVGAVLLLLVERIEVPTFRRPVAVAVSVMVLAVVNVVWTFIGRQLRSRLRSDEHPPPDVVRAVVLFANAQMTVDILILTVILRFSGGIENPMAVFYVFHMLIAALLLTPLNAVMQGAWALFLFGGLGIGECVGLLEPHYPFMHSTVGATFHADWEYVAAGIGVVGIGVFGTLYFTLQISSRLDEQEQELQLANQALRQSQEAIQLMQARRSRFMQTAAHQLKSPLTGVQMLAGLIRDGLVDADGTRDVLRRIVERCKEGIVQVTELLSLARIEEAMPARHRSAFTNVGECVSRVIGRWSDQANAKDIAIHLDVGGYPDLCAAVDKRDLDDCLGNLLDNAIKYTPSGGSIRVGLYCDDSTVSLSVKDTGMGIAEDHMDDILDPFRRGRLALAANIPGSGLGLTIVREVIEQAAGRLEIRSKIGEGSEFILHVPKRRSAADTPFEAPVASGNEPKPDEAAIRR